MDCSATLSASVATTKARFILSLSVERNEFVVELVPFISLPTRGFCRTEHSQRNQYYYETFHAVCFILFGEQTFISGFCDPSHTTR